MWARALDRIRAFLQSLAQKRRLAREIDPQAFLELTAELRDLAEAASKLWQQEPEFQARVRRIKSDMDQLEALAARPEFKRLPAERRLEIRKSLADSRQQLLDSMYQVPPPTTTLQ
ncbi:MAG: hypothetical protein AB1916_16225 [Thermodesulfobacteriota bacterium]